MTAKQDNPLDYISPGDIAHMAQAAKVTLVGSARFEAQFHEWSEKLTLAGMVVYSLAVFPSTKGGEKSWYTEEQKHTLDLVHLTKIVHSDCVVVLNVEGYVGESTRREIEFATRIGRPVYYLEGPPNVERLLDRLEHIERQAAPIAPMVTGASRDAEDFRPVED